MKRSRRSRWRAALQTSALPTFGLLTLLGLGGLGCGGAEPPPLAARRLLRRPPLDPARALLRHLPAGAQRCAVARPSLVSQRRRSMLLRIGWSEPLAWTRGLGVLAYAMGEKERADGSRVRRTLLRFARHPSRAELDERLPLRLFWIDEGADRSCRSVECRRLPRARFLDRRTLEISRGTTPGAPSPWAAGGAPRGVERSCARLITASPSMVEAAARATDPLGFGGVVRVERGIIVDREAATLRTRYRMRSERAADRLERELHAQAALGLASPIGPVPRSEIDRRGLDLAHRQRRSWEELELQLQDERIEREALALGAPREPLPAERLDPQARGTLRTQIRLRQRRLAAAPPGSQERRDEAAALATLLELSLRSAPDGEGLRERLFGLYLRELGQASRAATLAAAAQQEGGASWSLRYRAALSRLDASRLTGAILEAGLTDPEQAPALARSAIAAVAEGMRYEDVEAAWLATVALRAALPPLPSSWQRADLELPAVAGLAALASWGAGLPEGPEALYLTLRGRRRPGAISTMRALFLELPGEALLIGRGSATLGATYELAESLLASLDEGPLEVEGALIGLDGEPRARFALRGRLRAGALYLESALAPSPEASPGAPLEPLRRYLVAPLAQVASVESAWELRSESEEVARRLLETTRAAGASCRRARLWLRCEAPSREERLRLARVIARERLRAPEEPQIR